VVANARRKGVSHETDPGKDNQPRDLDGSRTNV